MEYKTRGRKENQDHYSELSRIWLHESPSYFTSYFNWLSDKSTLTRHMYLKESIKFYHYLLDELNYEETNDISIYRQVKPMEIFDFLSRNNPTNKTFMWRKGALSSFYKYLLYTGYDPLLVENPIKRVKSVRVNDDEKIVYLTQKQVGTLIYNIWNPDTFALTEVKRNYYMKYKSMISLFVSLAIMTGLRGSSLCQIALEDINFNNKMIKTVQKGNKVLYSRVDDRLLNEMKIWLKEREVILHEMKKDDYPYLFISSHGKMMTTQQWNRILEDMSFNIPVHVTCHVLRHTAGTLMYRKTGDIYRTKKLLGHSNVSTSMKYAHMDEETEEENTDIMSDFLYNNPYRNHNGGNNK